MGRDAAANKFGAEGLGRALRRGALAFAGQDYVVCVGRAAMGGFHPQQWPSD